jgi:hypothetical protein
MPVGLRVLFVGMSLAVLVSLSDSAHGEATDTSAPSTSSPLLDLPVAIVTELLPIGAYPVFITRSELLVGSPARSVLLLPAPRERSQYGVGGAHKSSPLDGYVTPFGQALAGRRCGANGKVSPVVVVYADADVEYRVLMDVLYSLSKLGYSDVFLATRSSTAQSQPADKATRGIRVRARRTATHTVELKPEGLTLRSQAGATFAPDCSQLSEPASANPAPLNLVAMAGCANKWVGPTGNLHLVTAGGTPVQAIVPVLETLSQHRAVTPIFPNSHTPDVRDGTIGGGPAGSNADNVSNAAKVVASLRPAFRACYDQELKVVPSRTGKLRLTIRVGAQGNVNEVTVKAEGELVSTVSCVKAVAEAAKFAPPAGGAAVIAVPVTFVKEQAELHGQKPPCTN